MSRVFARDSGASPEHGGELPLSPHPHYVTPRGLALLHERRRQVQGRLDCIGADPLHAAERSALQRERRGLAARIDSAIEVDAAERSAERVGFGSAVEIVELAAGEPGAHHRYQLVGEDEADPALGFLSWLSPLAQALLRARVGDVVVWRRPAGEIEVRVVSIL